MGGNRMSGRYELMDAYDSWHLTHLPGYLEALEEFAQKGGLKFLEAIGDYKFVGGHAHLCLAGTENWQPLHSDFVHPDGWATLELWSAPEHVAFMDMIFTLHPLTSDNAALRLVPGHPSTEKTYKQFVDDGYPPPLCMKLTSSEELVYSLYQGDVLSYVIFVSGTVVPQTRRTAIDTLLCCASIHRGLVICGRTDIMRDGVLTQRRLRKSFPK